MARREYHVRLQCAHEGCAERSFYVCETRREEQETRDRLRRNPWRCVRHTRASEVLETAAPERETVLVSYEKDYGGRQGVHRFWRPEGTEQSGSGFAYGPGFKAFANDFPTGTRLVISARVEVPVATASAPTRPLSSTPSEQQQK